MIFVSANSGSSPIASTKGGIGDEVAVAIAAENRRQVKPKPIDMIVVNPVTQAMKNHLANDRMIAVDRVSATGIIFVIALVILQHVVDRIFQSLEAEHWSPLIAFAGVVEHDIENDFDARFVERFDHLLELVRPVPPEFGSGGITSMRRKERQRIITPVVWAIRFWPSVAQDRKLVNRHQFDRRHAQRFEVRDFFNDTQVGPRMFDAAGLVIGESRAHAFRK